MSLTVNGRVERVREVNLPTSRRGSIIENFADVINGYRGYPSPLQLSWFLAWVSLDQRRIEQKRNGLLPFIVHGEWQRPERATGGKDLGDLVTGEAARVLQNGLFQAAVILAAVATLSVGIWGTSQIHVEYDFVNLLPRCLAHTRMTSAQTFVPRGYT